MRKIKRKVKELKQKVTNLENDLSIREQIIENIQLKNQQEKENIKEDLKKEMIKTEQMKEYVEFNILKEIIRLKSDKSK